MYWNAEQLEQIVEYSKGLITTWDVLKSKNLTSPSAMAFRLITTWDVLKLICVMLMLQWWHCLITTWDVLKYTLNTDNKIDVTV